MILDPGAASTHPPGAGSQLGLRFVDDDAPPQARHPMHLHLTSASPSDQQEIVARALDLGAGHLDVGQQPDEAHVALVEPGGYEPCVIEPEVSRLLPRRARPRRRRRPTPPAGRAGR
ncbi:VOC family protein [Actinotalea caeni]|uniref:VOC family protein n=1 Tax=Actinotalea caeni TaxID=1348467 RepID=UPI00139167C0